MTNKARLISGDTPTGKLHLGHWVGSLENRVLLQKEYECFFFVANVQGFTTRMEEPQIVYQNALEIVTDYLACGIDPEIATIFIQSEVPAMAELAHFFSMLVPLPRLMRNPTIKDEIRNKGLSDNYSIGFLMYPVTQIADILTFRAEVVPVGEDQEPHMELTREVARRFNQLYCGVNSHTEDADYIKAGGLFPIPQTKLGRTKRLVGTGAPTAEGQLLKMSKSLNNAIFLSDPPDVIRQKIMAMFTDPNRLRATDPGKVENNPLWIFHDTFNPDKVWIEEAKDKYRKGQIGDVDCKKRLIEILIELLKPMQERRKLFEKDKHAVLTILRDGTERANQAAEETLRLAKKAMSQAYFKRDLRLTEL
ncbi:MAG: trpS [Gammaproteobacteria bacterium]|jgi:tryptophanyl-tRNA synthetase|nr:trpS [Gammaproteobacteria bacterium]